MSHLLWGAVWIAIYLVLVLAPLFVLLIGPRPPALGFWWDFSLALGFAGTAMMGVQLLLTARFRHATAPYGIDIIYYFHRYLALLGFAFILAHPVILFLQNPALLVLLDPRSAPLHMTAGVASIAVLAALIVGSLARKQLRIHYDGWRVWHAVLAVVALALALLHMGGAAYYLATPWKGALWAAFAISWLAVIVYVRVLKPWHLWRKPYRVTAVIPERGDAWTLVVRPDGHAGLVFEPGQFAWLTLRSSPFAMKEHPFSIASSPAQRDRLEFTIKELGDFTRTIRDVAPGEVAWLDAPYGAFSSDRYQGPGYVFIAGGIGIAPIMSMLRALADRRDERPVLLFYAYRRWERLTFREQIEALRQCLDLRVVYALEEPPEAWSGEVGRVTREMLDRHLPRERHRLEYFICGPTPMIESVERSLYRLGVPLGQFHSELFDLV
jgi:predicted ferric reductase